jgi:hypothetical protein
MQAIALRQTGYLQQDKGFSVDDETDLTDRE